MSLSVASGLFEIQPGADDITIRGLTLIAGQEVAIKCGTLDYPPTYNCGATNVRIHGCTIRGFGSSGIQIDGGRNFTIDSSSVGSTGGTAVYLSGGNRSDLSAAGHVLVNSTVANFSRTCWSYQPGLALTGVGVTARNNEISHGPHQAVLWSGNDMIIDSNVIHDVVLETFDSAAIYASDRDWTMRGTSMINNLIYGVGNASTVCNAHTSCARHAIYLDSLTDGFNVTGNVVVQSDALKAANANGEAILDNGGRDNVVNGNMCIGWGLCISSDDAGLTWYAPGTGDYGNELRLLKAGLANAVYTDRYPAMAALDAFVSLPLLGNCSERESCGPAPWGNTIRGNVAINASTTPPFDGPRGCVELPDERQFPGSRFDTQDNRRFNSSAEDLGFVSSDPGTSHCYALNPSSVLLACAFRQPLEKVGTTAWRKQWPCKSDDLSLTVLHNASIVDTTLGSTLSDRYGVEAFCDVSYLSELELREAGATVVAARELLAAASEQSAGCSGSPPPHIRYRVTDTIPTLESLNPPRSSPFRKYLFLNSTTVFAEPPAFAQLTFNPSERLGR